MNKPASPVLRLIRELRRRRVFRTAALYIVGIWLVLQVADVIFPALDISERAIRYLLIGAVAGFPVIIVFGWFFDIGSEGIKRTPSAKPDAIGAPQPLRRTDYIILAALAAVVGMILYNVVGNVAEEPGLARQATGDGPPMVAVLPFTSVSLEGESGFFAVGVHDDLLTQLSQLEAVRVISRTSVLEYQDTILNIREIGAALGADAILEGGVQSAGKRIRINAQLIDARTDEHLWAQTYDRELSPTNIFEVQTEIARAITSAMHTTLTPQDVSQLAVIPTENMAAYRVYRRAMDIAEESSTWKNPEYQAALEKAVELDPGFTRALAELGGHLAFSNNWGEPNEEEVRRSEDILETLHELAPDSVDHLIAQAYYSMYILKEYDQTFEIITRAERKAPSDLKILSMKSWILRRQGKHTERNDVFRKILKLDPRNEQTSWALIFNLLVTRNYDLAWQELEKASFSGIGHTELRAMMELAQHGDYDLYVSKVKAMLEEYKQETSAWQTWEALFGIREFNAAEDMLESLLNQRFQDNPGLGGYRAGKLLTYWSLGKEDLLQQTLEEVRVHFEASRTREIAKDQPGLWQDLALYETLRGNKEEAIRYLRQWRRDSVEDGLEQMTSWGITCQTLAIAMAIPEAVECLRTGFEQPTWVFPFLEPHLPYYDLIRDSPEFQALMAEIEV